MINFGFQGQRSATVPGLNAKLPEVLALMARAKLEEIEAVCESRAAVEAAYREALGDRFILQAPLGTRRAIQFMPVMLPEALAGQRTAIVDALAVEGVGWGQYFSPHLGQQPWFRCHALTAPTPLTTDIAGRMRSPPVPTPTTSDT